MDHSSSRRSPDRRTLVLVAVCLAIQAGLLASSAARHSPTGNEPGHLVAGLCHWKFGRFEPYRVNPPLTRALAALPVIAAGYHEDWTRFYEGPGARPEFAMGADFISANGERSPWLFTLARWACLPIALGGSVVCFLWSREFWKSDTAGLVSLVLWTLDPNILAHGELVTPDCAAATFGLAAGYAFWRWCGNWTWRRACLAGLALGFAELSKFTWVILLPLWPLLWMASRLRASPRNASEVPGPPDRSLKVELAQLGGILGLGILIVNLGYAFDGTGSPLGELTFVSKALRGKLPVAADEGGRMTGSGNRFRNSIIGRMPIPFPRQYLLGIDAQKADFENFTLPSYVRGRWSSRGWWYYYLYGIAVKTPHGTQVIFLLALLRWLSGCSTRRMRDLVFLWAPPTLLLILVSTETAFSHHVRYVLPMSGFVFVFCGVAATSVAGSEPYPVAHASAGSGDLQQTRGNPQKLSKLLTAFALLAVGLSTLRVYPHLLTYFNEASGGPAAAHRHLRHSNIDWGQDLLLLKQFARRLPIDEPIFLFARVPYRPQDTGLHVDVQLATAILADEARLPAGIYALCGSWLDGPRHDAAWRRICQGPEAEAMGTVGGTVSIVRRR